MPRVLMPRRRAYISATGHRRLIRSLSPLMSCTSFGFTTAPMRLGGETVKRSRSPDLRAQYRIARSRKFCEDCLCVPCLKIVGSHHSRPYV